MRRRISIAPLCAAALAAIGAVAGCGNYERTYHAQAYAYSPRTAIYTKTVPTDESRFQTDTDALSSGDPLAGSDPLTRDVPAAHYDPLVGRSDALMRGQTTHGWYWLDGTVEGGELDIALNGISVGRYTVPMQITKYLHPGVNTITFTHYPTSGSGLCRVHLTVSDRRPSDGDAPVLTYDTAMTPRSTPALPMPGAPTVPGAPVQPGSLGGVSLAPQPSAGPVIETRSFTAE